MTLYEFGILKSGVEVFKKIFYKKKEIRRYSDDAKGQMFDGIISLSKLSFNEYIDIMKLKHYKFQFITREIKVDNIPLPIGYLLYCIGDRKLNTKFSDKLLNRVMNLYMEVYEKTPESNNIIIKIPPNSEFEYEVDHIIGDFYKTSSDRMKNLFY